MSELKVDLSKTGNAAVIVLAGSFVKSQVSQFRRACSDSEESTQHSVVDLTDVDEIDGYGLSSLVGLLARRRSNGGEVRLCGLDPELRQRFEKTFCDELFRFTSSVAKGISTLTDGVER